MEASAVGHKPAQLDSLRVNTIRTLSMNAVQAANSAHPGTPMASLIGTGTEVGLCVEAYEKLVAGGVRARVVSLPSWEIFEHQDEEYKESVIPQLVRARVAVEQAATFGWSRYVNSNGAIIGMKTFGACAPHTELTKKFGFTVENMLDTAEREMDKYRG